MDLKRRKQVVILLSRSKSEKLCKVTSIKLPWSLAEATKLVAGSGGFSSFVREALKEKLTELVEQ
jgi:hypothetical protein